MNINSKNCSTCGHMFTLDLFISTLQKGRITKTCLNCRDKNTKYNKINNKIKCQHDKRPSRCVLCFGSEICPHKKIRGQCIQCVGSSICEHNKQRFSCKICNDPVEITLKKMITNSKTKDQKHNRLYDTDDFINTQFLYNLIGDPDDLYCAYYFCDTKLNFIGGPALASIERINNDLAHIKTNCVISCLSCNIKRVGNKINLKNNH